MSHPDEKPDTSADPTVTPTDAVNPDDALEGAGKDTPLRSAPVDESQDLPTGDGEAGEEAAAPSLQEQLNERTEDLQRVTAEYANFRKRTAREREALVTHAKTTVITDFLPVIDDLDLASKHGDLEGPLKSVHGKLTATFDKLGVKRFADPGDPFDPEIHEAVQDLSSGDDKVIGTVLRPGFMLGDKLVRTAMVIIADPETDSDTQDS